MVRDTEQTDMVFRTDSDGVFVLFPHDVCDRKGSVTTYQHVGQHSGANYKSCITNSRQAKQSEIKPLLKELKSIGYNVKIIKRQNYDKYLKSYYEVRSN